MSDHQTHCSKRKLLFCSYVVNPRPLTEIVYLMKYVTYLCEFYIQTTSDLLILKRFVYQL